MLALFVAEGIFFACLLPLFEGWDEYQHLAYIVFLEEHGRAPVLGHDIVPRSLLAAMRAFPVPPHAAEQLEGPGIRTYAEYWHSGHAPLPSQSEGSVLLYQAQHSSLFYRLVRPLFRAAGGLDHIAAAISAVRLLNLLFGALTVALVVAILDRMVTWRGHAFLIGLLVVGAPLFLLNFLRVANDGLAIFLATAGMAAALSLHTVEFMVRWGRLAGGARYAAIALPWLLCLVYEGFAGWGSRLARGVLTACLAGVLLAAGAYGSIARMVSYYGGGATGETALRRLASLHPPWLGTGTLVAAGLVAAGLAIASLAVAAGLLAREPAAPRGRPRPRLRPCRAGYGSLKRVRCASSQPCSSWAAKALPAMFQWLSSRR